jgi:inhibitor of the pro-sigma K processing machinery
MKSMDINYNVLFAYIIGILILYILGRLFLIPIKITLKLVYNGLVGGMAILAINYVGGMFDFHIAFNAVSSLITGILGIPGLLLLAALKYALMGV